MTRTQTLLVTAALALTVPLAATAQTATTKCGPVAFSSASMSYTSAPCAGGESAGTVGTSGPTVFGANNSSSMTKAEQKQGITYAPGYAPMQAQAVMAGPAYGAPAMAGPSAAMADQSCGSPNAATIRDEYGRRYNCRGDRIR
jgi:hypothetical protein